MKHKPSKVLYAVITDIQRYRVRKPKAISGGLMPKSEFEEAQKIIQSITNNKNSQNAKIN
jgi:hypothetical protein